MTNTETDKREPSGLLTNVELHRLKERVASYSRDSSVQVEVIEPDRAGKDQPESWAIDLKKGKIYVDPRYFSDNGYSQTQAEFATYHEAEHLRELLDLLNEPNGDRVWRRHSERAKASRRYHLLDNYIADIRGNRSVDGRAPSVKGEKQRLYREQLFPQITMSGRPKHLQLIKAILRESQLDEQCELDGDVRDAINRLKEIRADDGRDVLDIMTDPTLDPSARLELQEEYLEPVYERFFEEDVEVAKSGKAAGSESPGSTGESGQGSGDPSDKTSGENKDPATSPSQPGGEGKGEGGQTPLNPEDLFKGYYNEAAERSPSITTNPAEIEGVVNEYLTNRKGKSAGELNEEAYARAEGITLEQLWQYRRIYEQVMRLRDSETGELVVERLRQLFEQIIAERMLPKTVPQFPRSEGEVLINPAQAYADVLAGKEESESWMTFATKERPKQKYGNFDLHMVMDRSDSMATGGKQEAQLVGAVLIQEALQELISRLNEERARLKNDLNIRVEERSFGVGQPPHDVLKPLDSELSERQRVAVAEVLLECSGVVTPDYLSLEAILESASEEEWVDIVAQKRRKVVIVLTDGDSSDAERVASALEKLREKGATVVALGMTVSAESVEETYSPDGSVVEEINQLASVLAKLLESFLAELR